MANASYKYMLSSFVCGLLFSPLLVCKKMYKALSQCAPLLDGKGGEYLQFSNESGLNALFYLTQANELKRNGRFGTSNTIGLGNYPLSRWFHVSLLSNYLYATMGVTIVLLSQLAWLFSWAVWVDYSTWPMIALVFLFAGTSGIYYYCVFYRMNYNALGWAFLPVAMYCSFSMQPELAAFFWLLVAFGSLTIYVMGACTVFIWGVCLWTPSILIALLPGMVKILFQFVPMITNGDFKESIYNMAKAIRLVGNKQTVRYSTVSVGWNTYRIPVYLFAMLAVMLVLGRDGLSSSLLFALFFSSLIPIVNVRFRFADPHNTYQYALSIGIITLLLSNSYFAIFPFYLLCSTPILFTNCSIRKYPPKLLNYTKITKRLETFFSEIIEGDRVFFAFPTPTSYEECFNGQSILTEPARYVASKKGFLLFPDWYAVFETNTVSSPSIWADTVEEMMLQCKYWNATYLITSQPCCRAELSLHGFKFIKSFSWSDVEEELNGHIPSTVEKDKLVWNLYRFNVSP